MKKLVLLICLLFPLTVFGANLKFGSNYFDCTNFQTKGITYTNYRDALEAYLLDYYNMLS